MAGGDGEIRERLGSLVAHAERFEPVEGLLGKPGALFAQVELQVHFRLIEVTQSHVVAVVQFFTSCVRSLIQANRPRVLPAQVVQIGNVVVSFGYKQRHAVPPAVGAGFPIGMQCPLELIQADPANRHVAQNSSDIGRFPAASRYIVGAFVRL